mgnify:CR=1 FL=1
MAVVFNNNCGGFFSCTKSPFFLLAEGSGSIAKQTISVLVADSNRHLIKGLSGRKDFGKYNGMLFVFPTVDRYVMVMRDMNFAIDIVWLNNYRIVDMAPNVKPEPGVSSLNLRQYQPRASSDMVLELPALFTSKNKLKIGDSVTILR